MANLVNPTPLNVASPAQASALPAPAKSAPPVLEAKPPQLAVAGHTAGPPGYATPHTRPPVVAATGLQIKNKP